jgi:hypothetical protein
MKSTVCLSALMLCYMALIGQTPVPAGDIFGIGGLAGSPYLIEGNITVPDDSTPVIEPGVRVEFQGSYTMFVQGRILA